MDSKWQLTVTKLDWNSTNPFSVLKDQCPFFSSAPYSGFWRVVMVQATLFSSWNSKCWCLWFPRAKGTVFLPLGMWEQGCWCVLYGFHWNSSKRGGKKPEKKPLWSLGHFQVWDLKILNPEWQLSRKKKNPWISSITESQINKEIIFVILSGTDDCSLVIC